MDGQRFDELTRAFARGVTRRDLIARLAGGALGGVLAVAGISGAAAQRTLCSGDGTFCLRDANCCSGLCDGRICAPTPRCPRGQVACGGNCVDEKSFATDPHNCGACGSVCGGERLPADTCEEWVCNAGRCATQPVTDRTACDDGDPCTYRDQCQRGACRGFAYRCDDGNPCTTQTCDRQGGCTTGNHPTGTVCGANGETCRDGACARIESQSQPGDPCEFDVDCASGDICRSPSEIQFCDPEYPCEGGICCRDIFSHCTADADCCPGFACCEETCVQLSYPGHCGSCDNACEPAGPCQAATCEDGACRLWNVPDGTSCGEQECVLDGQCAGGECVGAPAIDGTACSAQGCVLDGQCTGGVCQGTIADDGTHCGEATPCQYAQSLTCLDGVCHGYVFWDGVSCGEDQECVDGICVAAFGDNQGPSEGESGGTTGGPCGSGGDCPNGQACCMGLCTDVSSDPRHCGFCGHSCPPPGAFCRQAVCETGICSIRGVANGTSCADNMCIDEGVCQDNVCLGAPIREGEGCRHPQSSCVNDPICQAGDCVGSPRADGAACDDYNPCTSPDGCTSGICGGIPVANGTPCGPRGYTCQAGACVPLTVTGGSGAGGSCLEDDDCDGDHLRCCGDICLDVQNSVNTCGDCGNVCEGDPAPCQTIVCSEGTCGVVPLLDGTFCMEGNSAFACCGGACVDMTAEANCGVCGRTCAGSEVCCNLACADPRTDAGHCGGCNNQCAAGDGEVCCGGECFFKGDCAECACDEGGCACV